RERRGGGVIAREEDRREERRQRRVEVEVVPLDDRPGGSGRDDERQTVGRSRGDRGTCRRCQVPPPWQELIRRPLTRVCPAATSPHPPAWWVGGRYVWAERRRSSIRGLDALPACSVTPLCPPPRPCGWCRRPSHRRAWSCRRAPGRSRCRAGAAA